MQSFGLPSIKSKPLADEKFGIYENSFGVPDLFTNGIASARSNVDSAHPLARSELNVHQIHTVFIFIIKFEQIFSIVKMLIK